MWRPRPLKIIIDGPDCAGKTTLANALMEVFKIETYIHLNGKDNNDYKMHKSILDLNTSFVCDRFMYGELTYSTIYKRKVKLSISDMSALLKQINEEGVIYIFATAPTPVLINRAYGKGENAEIIKTLPVVKSTFDAHSYYGSINRKICYDTNLKFIPTDVIEAITIILEADKAYYE